MRGPQRPGEAAVSKRERERDRDRKRERESETEKDVYFYQHATLSETMCATPTTDRGTSLTKNRPPPPPGPP